MIQTASLATPTKSSIGKYVRSWGVEPQQVKDLKGAAVEKELAKLDDSTDAPSSSSTSSTSEDISENFVPIEKHIKKYSPTTDKLRYSLFKLVNDHNISIRKASQLLGINYSTAKTILQIYKKEGRIAKKTWNYKNNPSYRKWSKESTSSHTANTVVDGMDALNNAGTQADLQMPQEFQNSVTIGRDGAPNKVDSWAQDNVSAADMSFGNSAMAMMSGNQGSFAHNASLSLPQISSGIGSSFSADGRSQVAQMFINSLHMNVFPQFLPEPQNF